MKFTITTSDYLTYFENTAKILMNNHKRVTELDSLLGDGDHMVNLYSGYEKVLTEKQQLIQLSFPEMLKKIGMIILSGVGGSSGLLYGSAYIACGKKFETYTDINQDNFEYFIQCMMDEIIKRGQVKPGDKTMLDSMFKALEAYKESSDCLLNERINRFKKGAIQGMYDTEIMSAQKGRGRYHATKGVGIIDAGAMTMALQMESLSDFILSKIESE